MSETSAGPTAADRTSFVILCLGRTGSSHLSSLLDSHPQIRCYGEVLDPEGDPAAVGGDPSGPGVVEVVDKLLDSAVEPVSGFKLPMNAIRAYPPSAAIPQRRPELRVVRLSRRNRLAQIVSRRLMSATDVAHSIYGDYGDTRVRIDPDACLRAIATIEEEERELDGLCTQNPVFRIAYEELGCERRLVELQRFLGVEPAELRSWFTRLRTRPLAETIANWDEVAAALRAHGHDELSSD